MPIWAIGTGQTGPAQGDPSGHGSAAHKSHTAAIAWMTRPWQIEREEAATMLGQSQRNVRRRSVLGGAGAVLASPRRARAVEPVTLGLTPVVVESDLVLLAAMEKELSARIRAPVVLVKRRTYQEIMAMLLARQVTAAWICGFPFVRHRDQLSILAAPLYNGAPLYIAPTSSHRARRPAPSGRTSAAGRTPSRTRTAIPAGSSPRTCWPPPASRRTLSSAAPSSPTGIATSSAPWPRAWLIAAA